MRLLAVLIVTCAALAGCQTPPRAIVAPRPPLDLSLAMPCEIPPPPADLADYDATDDWVMHQVLPALADCARRHAAIVGAW